MISLLLEEFELQAKVYLEIQVVEIFNMLPSALQTVLIFFAGGCDK